MCSSLGGFSSVFFIGGATVACSSLGATVVCSSSGGYCSVFFIGGLQ